MYHTQMKIREEREAKRATMDGRHEFILTTVADRLGITIDDAEEFMLDGDHVSIAVNSGNGIHKVQEVKSHVPTLQKQAIIINNRMLALLQPLVLVY